MAQPLRLTEIDPITPSRARITPPPYGNPLSIVSVLLANVVPIHLRHTGAHSVCNINRHIWHRWTLGAAVGERCSTAATAHLPTGLPACLTYLIRHRRVVQYANVALAGVAMCIDGQYFSGIVEPPVKRPVNKDR